MAVDKNTGFKRIHDLPSEKKMQLDGMFYDGTSVAKIVFACKNGLGLFTDVKDAALSKYLYRYKWEVIDKNIAVRAQQMETNKTGSLVLAHISTKLNALEEIGVLVEVQKTRVKKLLDQENKMPALFNQLGNEMKTLAGFLEQFTDLSFAVGTMTKVPQVTKITAANGQQFAVESTGKSFMEGSVEAHMQLESAASEFFSILDGEFTEVLPDALGE